MTIQSAYAIFITRRTGALEFRNGQYNTGLNVLAHPHRKYLHALSTVIVNIIIVKSALSDSGILFPINNDPLNISYQFY
jgi:hypothetical protein